MLNPRYQAPTYQVTCVRTTSTYFGDVLTHVGFAGSLWPVQDVALALRDETYRLYTYVSWLPAMLVPVFSASTAYVRTEADTTSVNNLLSLPRC